MKLKKLQLYAVSCDLVVNMPWHEHHYQPGPALSLDERPGATNDAAIDSIDQWAKENFCLLTQAIPTKKIGHERL